MKNHAQKLSTYSCYTCQFKCNGEIDKVQHINSRRHRLATARITNVANVATAVSQPHGTIDVPMVVDLATTQAVPDQQPPTTTTLDGQSQPPDVATPGNADDPMVVDLATTQAVPDQQPPPTTTTLDGQPQPPDVAPPGNTDVPMVEDHLTMEPGAEPLFDLDSFGDISNLLCRLENSEEDLDLPMVDLLEPEDLDLLPMHDLVQDRPIAWASMYPGAGGGDFGYKEAFGSQPRFFITAPGSPHEKYLPQLFPGVRVVTEAQVLANLQDFSSPQLDVVTCLPACAGLSSLNNSTGQHKSGSDNEKNRMMVQSSRFILEKLKPVILIGENAPALYQKKGEGVVLSLIQVAQETGYSLTLYRTCSRLHALPQRRERTFYIYYKGPQSLQLGWIKAERLDLLPFLNKLPPPLSIRCLSAHWQAL